MQHQLPRKRHTPHPPSKASARPLPKHVARPKPKPASTRTPAKPRTSRNHHPRPEKRGTNRTLIPGANIRGINQFSARRILASRPHPSSPLKTQYKIQWETTWEDSSTITGLASVEWKEAVREGSTFDFKASDGSVWTVLKDATCLENDSDDSQWEMWRAIRRNAVQEVEKDWFGGLREDDYAFANEKAEREAREALGGRWEEEDICAKNVLRAAWSRGRYGSDVCETDALLGGIKVRYLAQLDPWVDGDGDELAEDFHEGHRSVYTVEEIVCSIQPNPLENLGDETFSKGAVYGNCVVWRKTLENMIRKTPFMFRSGTWMQLFAFLMLGSESFREILNSVGIAVQDDWCQRAKEYDMHMYYDQIVDNRSPHDIQETFINLRDFFRDLKAERQETERRKQDEVETLDLLCADAIERRQGIEKD